MMEKLKMHSINKVDENIEKIGRLFPNCITEKIDDGGGGGHLKGFYFQHFKGGIFCFFIGR